jgi:hypothetical protein
VRYTCFVAILIALPVAADAQSRIVAGRNDHSAQTQTRSGQSRAERRAEQRPAEQRRAEPRHVEQRPTNFLAPIGLPPPQTQRMPWWEQRQNPWWEQKRTPSWERQQVPVSQMNNVARHLLDEQRDARRLAKTPRPVHPIYRPGHGRPPVVYWPWYGYFPYTTYGYGFESSTTTEVAPPPPEPETGFLRIEVEPRHLLQVFVDGLYIGTIADLGDDIELRLGVRRIELRAPGYLPLIFDTRIEFDRTVVYRGVLERRDDASATSAPAAPIAPVTRGAPVSPVSRDSPVSPASRTMYLIPGCYMGNVEPTAAMLRPGCDIGKLTKMTPP